MIDNCDTNPAIIRANRSSRGKNARLNVQKTESLGVNASDVSPTQGRNAAEGTGTASLGPQLLDPVLVTNPDTPTYGESTYEEPV